MRKWNKNNKGRSTVRPQQQRVENVWRGSHGARPITNHKEKLLLRKVASEKLVKRLDPRRADPSKGISAVGRSRPVGDFPKAPFDLSSETKTDTKKGGEEERNIVNGFIHR